MIGGFEVSEMLADRFRRQSQVDHQAFRRQRLAGRAAATDRSQTIHDLRFDLLRPQRGYSFQFFY